VFGRKATLAVAKKHTDGVPIAAGRHYIDVAVAVHVTRGQR
jgi:hypothetical protein